MGIPHKSRHLGDSPMGRKRSTSGARKLIRALYRLLGAANTATYLLAGNPAKLAKHLGRKRTTKAGARILR